MTRTVQASCAACGTAVDVLPVIAQRFAHAVRCTGCRGTDSDTGDQAPTRSGLWIQNKVPADCRRASIDEVPAGPMQGLLREVVSRWPDPVTTKDGRPVRAYPLGGPAGVGKSCAVWAVLIELIKSGKVTPDQVVAGTEEQLLVPASKVSAYASRNSLPTWRRIIPPTTKVVFVDDVGYGGFADDAGRVSTTKALMDRVLEIDAVLFMTTNMTAPDFTRLLGAAAASRLSAMSTLPLERPYFQLGTVDQRLNLQRAS